MTFALLLAACLGADPAAASAAVAFTFRDAAALPDGGRSMVCYRAIEFKPEPITPLSGDFEPAAGAQYGQLPVGPAPETALAVVWCPTPEDAPTLWFDADGDGRLTDAERHVVSEQEIAIPTTITVETEPEVRRMERTILFRRPLRGSALRYAVRGYAAGTLQLAGGDDAQACEALLVDGNADGRFDSVGEDRVWIDLNRDGRFSGLVEQFPLGKPISHAGQVYVVRSDPLAAAVSANLRRPGEGTLRLTLADGLPQEADSFSAELVSDLGELVSVDKLGEPVPVPYGQYRLNSLAFQVAAEDGQPWNYRFSRRRQREFSVPRGKTTSVALLDKIAMEVSFDLNGNHARPAQTVTVWPQLVAGDGSLYLSACTVGSERQSSEGSAEILLLSPDGETISRGTSGFS